MAILIDDEDDTEEDEESNLEIGDSNRKQELEVNFKVVRPPQKQQFNPVGSFQK